VAAPIGIIPCSWPQAPSPHGQHIQNTSTRRRSGDPRYPGRGTEFTLYDDDGVTYDYEKGQGGSRGSLG